MEAIAKEPWSIEFGRSAQVKAGIIGLAFGAVFYNELLDMQYTWSTSADWSHGPLIPLFSAYLVSTRWERVRACPIRHAWVGIVVMVLAMLLYQYSIWGRNIGYLRPTSMLVCLLGVVVALCGLPVLRWVWAPWAYLFLAVPLPKGFYFSLTDPLRQLAANVATHVLNLFPSLDIEQVGSAIYYYYGSTTGTLNVADACSGMRSTMTLCALGVAVAIIHERPLWQRMILIASCVPIAVFSNFIRVTTTCLLHIFVDPKYAGGAYHTALGLVTLMIAFGIFTGLGWVLSHLFVAEPDESGEGELVARPGS